MPTAAPEIADVQYLELAGVRYVILPERDFERLCAAAGIEPTLGTDAAPAAPAPRGQLAPLTVDDRTLAKRLIARRRKAGLSQAELARRAGVRVETLNRIERGRTTPDFATIRKLVNAINEAGK